MPLESIRSKEKNLDLFLSGEKSPTFNQLSNIASRINVPTGLLLLNDTINDEIDDLDFRTINSDDLEEFSSELKDTIKEMKLKQDFLREEVEGEVNFVGRYSIKNDFNEVAQSIRDYLKLPVDYYETAKKNNFAYLRNKVNSIGVFVFLNGKIKDNTHRPLDLNEFRGFVLSDKKAPIIFINQLDSKNGQVFTLIHELVHLFLNENEIFKTVKNSDYEYDPVEYFVNKVTAEILVPKEKINEYKSTLEIGALADKFNVSKFVIIRRLYDLNMMSKQQYDVYIKKLNIELEKRSIKKTSGGGNYKNNLNFRMDKPFVKYIENAILQNKISYTEGFNLLGVGYKGYKNLLEGNN